jgi:squalene synthase HpnC
LAQAHYENFPVASRLLPKKLRQAICAIYAFARIADDFADEGNLTPEIRQNKLNDLEVQLHYIQSRQLQYLDLNFLALADTIEKFNLPLDLFYDLLHAFKQDVFKTRYANFTEVLMYAKNSANPIGRILLYLTNNAARAQNLIMSDHICTALQFINMLQDFKLDLLERNRLYLPLDELSKFGLNADNLLDRQYSTELRQYLLHGCSQAKNLLSQGAGLPQYVSRLLAIELKLIIKSAYTILEKLEQNTNIYQRVKLHKFDIFKIFCKVIFNG